MTVQASEPSTRRAAGIVGLAVIASRLFGLAREIVFAAMFGAGKLLDVYIAAFRIPNMLQNLFGEGVLSASFIPVYARLNAEERHEEATRTAAAIFAILVMVGSVLVLLGVLWSFRHTAAKYDRPARAGHPDSGDARGSYGATGHGGHH